MYEVADQHRTKRTKYGPAPPHTSYKTYEVLPPTSYVLYDVTRPNVVKERRACLWLGTSDAPRHGWRGRANQRQDRIVATRLRQEHQFVAADLPLLPVDDA